MKSFSQRLLPVIKQYGLLSMICVVAIVLLAAFLINKQQDPPLVQQQNVIINSKTAPEVEVLDATGSAKSALEIIEKIRAYGYDVVEFRRLSREPIDKSYMVVYNNKLNEAKKLAKLLGIEEERISNNDKSNPYVDISIIIGKDVLKKRKE